MSRKIDIQSLEKGDRRTLGRAITLLESSRSDHREQAEALLASLMPKTGGSLRIGITGVPGVGKSSFIEVFGNHIIEQGKRVAVLTIDPSSSLTGGSILGDKTRMQTLSVNPGAFIRPSPSNLTLGGVARRTQETILLCEAAGFDVIIVETVGVGQSETLVANMTDVFLLMLLPSGGDDLQGIKRGIMELADIAIVNKADGSMKTAATRSAADLKHALQLIQPRFKDWKVPVELISALEKTGIDSVWEQINRYVGTLGEERIKARRSEQSLTWFWSEAREGLMERLRIDARVQGDIKKLENQVQCQSLPPSIAAGKLVDAFLGELFEKEQ